MDGEKNFSNVGSRLSAERERLGFGQELFAEMIGKSRRTLTAWENDEQAPNAHVLIAMAAHGVDVLYVLTGQRGLDTVGALSAEEAALVDNYRAAGPAHQASLRQVGAAFAEQGQRKEQARKAGNQ